MGFLGEQSQYGWWPSAFFTASSRAFFAPIFSKTAFMAQYQGVKEAASRVHDDHIGVGRVYHLFRLPEHVEQAIFHCLQDQALIDALQDHCQDREGALESLSTLAGSHAANEEGPVLVGDIDQLLHGNTLGMLGHHYLSAFTRETRAYPYYADRV